MANKSAFPSYTFRRIGRTNSPIRKAKNIEDEILLVWKHDGSIYATAEPPSAWKAGSFVKIRKPDSGH